MYGLQLNPRKGLTALLLGAVILSGCGKGPKMKEYVPIDGTVVETVGKQSSDGTYPGGRHLLVRSDGQLYHISTANPNRWTRFQVGNRISLAAHYGGSCNNQSIFDSDSSWRRDVVDLLYVSTD